jgi:hypothetical protein
VSENPSREAAAVKSSRIFDGRLLQQPALQLVYDTAPIGLAVLSPDCRYLQINQRLTRYAVFQLKIIWGARFATAYRLWLMLSKASSVPS